MKTETYLYFKNGQVPKVAVQHRYILKLREAIGMCSSPPSAAHYLRGKYGRSLGAARDLWPEVDKPLAKRMDSKIRFILNDHSTRSK